jgi:rhamnosyltransferase
MREKISLCMLTYNAMQHSDIFIKTLKVIENANLHRVLIIDSSSSDNTVSVISEFNFETLIIKQCDFNHGETRELAHQQLVDSDYIIYLTQDVLLVSGAINELVSYVVSNQLAAAYGRQLPHKNANCLARHLREFNYGDVPYIRSYDDSATYGIQCAFASDSFSIYRVSALGALGGFPRLNFGEDTYMFANLLVHGYKIGYAASAICYHSHNHTIIDEFVRYIGLGELHAQHSYLFKKFGNINIRGRRFVVSQFYFLLKHAPLYIPVAAVHIIAKYLGYKFGVWCSS